MDRFSVCIIGAGVIGLAIAERLGRSHFKEHSDIVLLEQEPAFGQHTSSRHSEVIHAGIYYPQNSLKAEYCVQGQSLLYEFCKKYDVPHQKIGKCIVTNEVDTLSLEALKRNANANGVTDLEYWDAAKLQGEEPSLSARHAIHSPSTGIIDSHTYMRTLHGLATDNGVVFAANTRVLTITKPNETFYVHTSIGNQPTPEDYTFACNAVINCAGPSAQSIAGKIDRVITESIPALYLCKGDYFAYSKRNPFKHLIYPMPEKNTVGLGIHSTQDLSGRLRFGPDTEYVADVTYDIDASKKEHFAESIRQYFPRVETEDLQPAYSGIRPKIAGPAEPPADFMIQDSDTHGVDNLVQLFGIESPGLTSSLAIAEAVFQQLKS